MAEEHIDTIFDLFFEFKSNEISKIFNKEDFGYWKITVDRPLRLKSKFTAEVVADLRFTDSLRFEMQWMYKKFGNDVYENLKKHKPEIENWLNKNEIKISPANKKKALNTSTWKQRKVIMDAALKLLPVFEKREFNNFNEFSEQVEKKTKELKLNLSSAEKKTILMAMSWKDETAEPVVKKTDEDGTIHYEPDSDLRDSENVPLSREIQDFFEKEVIPYVPDAWIDHSKTIKGYSISFTRYFYNYEPPRDLEEIKKEIIQLEQETEGILEEIVND